MTKRILAVLLTLALLTGCAAAETAPEATEITHAIEMKTFPFYLFSSQQTWPEEFPLYFADGVDDLPYVDLRDWADFLNWLCPSAIDADLYGGYQVTVQISEADNRVQYTRENGFNVMFDFNENVILWDDYAGFLQQTVGAYMELSGFPHTDSEGRPFMLSVVGSRDRYGDITELHLDEYGISMIAQDGKYLLPLQTLSALFISEYQVGTFFNREVLIADYIASMTNPQKEFFTRLLSEGLLTEEAILEIEEAGGTPEEIMTRLFDKIMETDAGREAAINFQITMLTSTYPLYAQGPSGDRSPEMTAYGFEELCMELDFFYGLKDAHNIADFHTFFLQSGLSGDLLDPDADKADSAVARLTQYWLDDGHSGFYAPSYLSENDPAEEGIYGISSLARHQTSQTAKAIRSQHPEAKMTYCEVGNTAYITFDVFSIGQDEDGKFPDYYALAELDQLPDDTIGLIIRAHQLITRENSPIENVVLDLSCNGGGAAPAAIFVLGWFLGDAQISLRNTLNGAESTTFYRADVNLDHQFDEKDTVSHLNLYCLISPLSFSCGNLVPWAFKSDGRVTLLGKVSGGGSCVVQPMTTAWGSTFQISGTRQISFTKNGAYYDVDQGVEPDYFIRSYDHFYDREALTEFINSLY